MTLYFMRIVCLALILPDGGSQFQYRAKSYPGGLVPDNVSSARPSMNQLLFFRRTRKCVIPWRFILNDKVGFKGVNII